MREIKMRVWNESLRKWDYFTPGNILFYKQTWELHILNGDEFYLFTGLKDKQGKELFEGDIVINERGEKGVIKFGNGRFVSEYLPPFNWDVMEPCDGLLERQTVIGNIYENKDLL